MKPIGAAAGMPYLLASVPNFRDLGGIVNAQGRRVRRGLVYRSELLSALTAPDLATLADLHIGSVFDLRNPSERAAAPTGWPQPGHAVSIQLMSEELRVPGADLRQLVKRIRNATLRASEAGQAMLTTYRVMPAHFGGMLRRLFAALAEPDGGAALVHCTAGKDRTGFVCAMLLFALDVRFENILEDYLSTARFYSVERLVVQIEKIAGQSLDPAVAAAIAELAQVKASYLDAALNEITRGWQSLETYLHDQAGLDIELRARLHARLLD